jgi:hypothetical protein
MTLGGPSYSASKLYQASSSNLYNNSTLPTVGNPISFGMFRGSSKQISTPKNFPPAALTGATTTLIGQTYGNGTYDLSASSFLAATSWPLHAAFNYVTTGSDTWSSSDFYNGSGAYTGGKTLTISGSVVAGEWIQIQLPTPIALTSITIWPFTSDITRNPKNFQVAGSANGTTWTLDSKHRQDVHCYGPRRPPACPVRARTPCTCRNPHAGLGAVSPHIKAPATVKEQLVHVWEQETKW